MQGVILEFDKNTNKGLIRGDDENKYQFKLSDFKTKVTPRNGLKVDFDADEDVAINVYSIEKDTIAEISSTASEIATKAKPKVFAVFRTAITLFIAGAIIVGILAALGFN